MYVKPRQKLIERAAIGKRRRRALQFVSKKRKGNKRIVIELVSAADVARLDAQDKAIEADITQKLNGLSKRIEGVHGQLYETINRISMISRQ